MKLVMMASIMNPKEIENRNEFQVQLKILLEAINNNYSNQFVNNFKIQSGDKIVGVLHSFNNVAKILDEINLGLFPIKIKWGLGLGTIETTSLLLQDEELDGPAFWNAKEALETIVKYDYYGKSLSYFKSDASGFVDERVNSLLRLQDSLRLTWTRDQSFVIESIIKKYGYEKFVQKEFAKEVNLSTQRISNIFAATSFKQYAISRKLLAQEIINMTVK